MNKDKKEEDYFNMIYILGENAVGKSNLIKLYHNLFT